MRSKGGRVNQTILGRVNEIESDQDDVKQTPRLVMA